MFYAVDSDIRPVRLDKLTREEAQALIDSGEAREMMSANAYQLVWAKRHGAPARWFVFPRLPEGRAGLTIYVENEVAA